MILHIEKVIWKWQFQEMLNFTLDTPKYYVRRSEWPKEVYMQFKYNIQDKEYLQRMYLIDNNCDIHETEIGWETCIGINEVMSDDWEIWFATIA